MSFAALAGGGAECGPANPLAQLSKAYHNDRGVQQDHFAPQASGSRSGFRANIPSSQGIPDEAAHFFQHQAAHHHNQKQPFDLSPLNRALGPASSASAATTRANTPPAWAQAFQQQSHDLVARSGSPAESEAFRRAFQQPGGGGAAEWSGDYVHQQEQQSRLRERQAHGQPLQQTSAGPMYAAGQARLLGAGFGASAAGGMMMHHMPMQMTGHDYQQQHQQRDVVTNTSMSTDWETAFLAQEAEPLITQEEPALVTRPRSPVMSPDQARDALARTAGALLETVNTTQQTRGREEQDNATAKTSDKFANSTFLDLMRKLRDGEVAVEGDKVVEQIGPAVDRGKGRAAANDWASSFLSSAAASREEEGRAGATPMQMSGHEQNVSSGSALAEFTRRQHEYAQRQSVQAEMVRDMNKGYETMAGLWDDEDAVRATREANSKAKGKGKGVFHGDGGLTEDEIMADDDVEERTRERMHIDTTVPLASAAWEEDFDQEMISGGHASRNDLRTTRQSEPSAQQKEWDLLQQDWDQFDVTAAGFSAKSATTTPAVASSSTTLAGYGFAQNNPYVYSTRQHSMHAPLSSSTYDSVLQKEAAVQHNPSNSAAWLALGIKQQENEREDMAIKALKRAIELDPHSGEAYLALAVSYTNENERAQSYDSIDRWVETLGTERYARQVDAYRNLFGRLPNTTSTRDKHEYLTGLLITLAQSRAEVDGADVDAEVQIGLGVLFNTSEEYEKAGDCFESALSVRPDDPLLFNRLGATYANSGKTELAIQYYLEALDIQPGYVRARFNLAVANMNLGQYEEAVQHLLTSLSIQESESELEAGHSGTAPSGVTSQTLWDSLNICLLQMHRSDLAPFTAERNLKSIMAAFPPAQSV